VFLLLCACTAVQAQTGRLESEYKLDIPKGEVEALWQYIHETYAQSDFIVNDLHLSGQKSVETFIDRYYDAKDRRFSELEVSLRHRKRFKDGLLLKQLIQLKTPYSTDKVIRSEIKFDVDDNKNPNDLTKRHPLLQHLSNTDKDRMAYQLAAYDIRPEDIVSALKLKQIRKRVYIKNLSGESVATITLDKVSNCSFPFQSYAELELELNELRYTAASETERLQMTVLNDEIKSSLALNFPSLAIDQRSKYRKMQLLIESNMLSFFGANFMWFFFGLITLSAVVLFIKDQLG